MTKSMCLLAAGLALLLPVAVAAQSPILTVEEPTLGSWTFTEPTCVPISLAVPSGRMLYFHWLADASHYGGAVEGYRYGLDVIDPDDPNDPGWVTGFQPDLLAAAPILFAGGTHWLTVEARDGGGATTRACLQVTVDGGVPVDSRSWGAVKAIFGR